MSDVIEKFRRRFDDLNQRWMASIEEDGWPTSASDLIVRSAAKVEQAFGGINSQLWDDPFEWTLPEALGSRQAALEYFQEVENTRKQGFARFASDKDLAREIWTPWGQMSLRSLLEKTLAEAEEQLSLAKGRPGAV